MESPPDSVDGTDATAGNAVAAAASVAASGGAMGGVGEADTDLAPGAGAAVAWGIDGLRNEGRPTYQRTKAAIIRPTAISSHSVEPLKTGGGWTLALRTAVSTALGAVRKRGKVRMMPASGNVLTKVVDAGDRTPENLPAQPRQYMAPSRLAVWHDSQNLVIRMVPGAASLAVSSRSPRRRM